jgi:hypothetical protein
MLILKFSFSLDHIFRKNKNQHTDLLHQTKRVLCKSALFCNYRRWYRFLQKTIWLLGSLLNSCALLLLLLARHSYLSYNWWGRRVLWMWGQCHLVTNWLVKRILLQYSMGVHFSPSPPIRLCALSLKKRAHKSQISVTYSTVNMLLKAKMFSKPFFEYLINVSNLVS